MIQPKRVFQYLGLISALLWFAPATALAGDHPPEGKHRIVSLSPSLTEMICALDACDQLVGVTDYCTYPERVKKMPKVGGYIDPNLEIILAKRPTQILALPEHRDTTARLQRLGLKVDAVRNFSLADIHSSILKIGSLINRQTQAEAMVAQLKTRQSQLTKKRDRPPTVLMTLGHELRGDVLKEVYIVGRKGYINDMIKLVGGRNIYDSDTPHYPKLSHEMLLRYDPDIIIDLVPRNNMTKEERERHMRPWRAMKNLGAVREGRYYLIAQEFVLQAGPRYIETLERLSQILDEVEHVSP